MNHKLYLIMISTVCLMLPAAVRAQQDAPQQPMTLDDCLQYAYEHSQTLQNAALEQGIAKADVGITKADGLPQISGSVTYTNNVAIQTQFLPAIFIDPEAPPEATVPVRFGVPHTSNAGVSITQMIFDGSYFVGLKAANTYMELMRKDYHQSKIDIAEQVTKAYYTVLVNQEKQKQLSSNFNRLDTLLNETTLMFENGFAEKIEVDRIRVQYNNARTEKDKNDRLTEVSYLLLKFQMGMPVNQDIALADKLSDITEYFEADANAAFEYTDRVEFERVLVNRELAKLDLRNNRIQYLPKLSVNASFGYNTGVNTFNELTQFGERWFEYGFLGFSLEVPIFDGLRKHHTSQKTKLQLQQLDNQSQQLKNDIDVQIVQARVDVQNNTEALASQEENLNLARDVYEVAKTKYQEGVGSNIEVITSQDDLLTAENNYFSALYDALIAKVDLHKALGKLIQE